MVSVTLISALRRTAHKLSTGTSYQWGHMGSCNCGNLAQELTSYSSQQIHRDAVANGLGDWSEQLNDYCPTSQLPTHVVIFEMLAHGLTTEDLRHLERLSDPLILQRLPGGHRHLLHNNRENVILYLTTWADLLEEEWARSRPFREFYEEATQTREAAPPKEVGLVI